MSNRFAQALEKKPRPKDRRESQPGRGGRGKHIGGYFSLEVSRQLRQLALDEGSSVQGLLGEGLDMIFESRGLPTIARRTPGG